MPKYTYHCEECENYYDITHSMTERNAFLCIECSGSLHKVPSVPLSLAARKVNARTGDVVKSSIEDFRKDLKEQRTEALKKEV